MSHTEILKEAKKVRSLFYKEQAVEARSTATRVYADYINGAMSHEEFEGYVNRWIFSATQNQPFAKTAIETIESLIKVSV
jgi:hypothetical protein